MPNKRGPDTYKGFQSPKSTDWPKPIRRQVRRVYGAWRRKHPQEDPAIKARGSRIAWSSAKRKYPKLYAEHQNKEVKQEMKEHPWAGKKVAKRIAHDHAALEEARQDYITGG